MSVKFKAEAVAAILMAAIDGGRISDVVERSKVDISPDTIHGWLNKGRRDTRDGKETGFSVFAAMWGEMHPGTHSQTMVEMKKAVKIIAARAEERKAVKR